MKHKSTIPIASIALVVLLASSQSCSTGSDQTETPILPEPTKPEILPSPTIIEAAPTPVPAEPTPVPVILFEDDFSDPASGWERYDEFDGVLDYQNGGYRMWNNTEKNIFWVSLQEHYDDVRIEIEATELAGPDNGLIGVMCRYDQGNHGAYYFLISSEGSFGIGRFVDFSLELLGTGAYEHSGAILTAGETNQITAICQGPDLSLLINDQLLLEVQDDTLLRGAIGLLAGTVGEAGTDILYDNLIVTEP